MSKFVWEWANLRESIVMALTSVRTNKLRSILTLLGVVVGVFSIISVMTAVGVLRNSIEEGITQLGANTFQIQKYPVGIGGGNEARRRARNRKDITYEQALAVRDNATLAETVGIEVWRYNRVVRWKGERTNPNVFLAGENPEGLETNDWSVDVGRSISKQDIDLAAPVIILGKAVRDRLFPSFVDPIGERVKIDNGVYTVIGVFVHKETALGGNFNNFGVIPITSYFQEYGRYEQSINIMVKARSREVLDEAIEQCRFILRTARNVPPAAEDDFSWFSNDSLVREFNDFTLYFRLGVLVVSSIALLAAGVGIMNIMLVSVTERTREIGIRKAIGAQRRAILSQFMVEAVILCELGGVIGIGLGIVAGNVVGILLEVPAIVPWEWVGIGIGVCSLVGLLFGVYPAWKAAMLDPIEALRYE
jgi:putative ABC transport system permease protein